MNITGFITLDGLKAVMYAECSCKVVKGVVLFTKPATSACIPISIPLDRIAKLTDIPCSKPEYKKLAIQLN